MASAEVLRIAHNAEKRAEDTNGRVKGVEKRLRGLGSNLHCIDEKVQSLDKKVQDVNRGVQDIGNGVRDVDSKVVRGNRLSSLRPILVVLEYSDVQILTGNQRRDTHLRWLSPPNPSTNHNIAYDIHHHGTAQWFFASNTYNEWKSTGSFLWIRGKRTSLLATTIDFLTNLISQRALGRQSSGFYHFIFFFLS